MNIKQAIQRLEELKEAHGGEIDFGYYSEVGTFITIKSIKHSYNRDSLDKTPKEGIYVSMSGE